MAELIIAVIFGLGMALFATQNTNGVTITLANSPLTGVPLYLIVIISILLGLLISFLISLVQSISSSLTIRGKDNALKSRDEKINGLEQQLHNLELENAQLKGEKKKESSKK